MSRAPPPPDAETVRPRNGPAQRAQEETMHPVILQQLAAEGVSYMIAKAEDWHLV